MRGFARVTALLLAGVSLMTIDECAFAQGASGQGGASAEDTPPTAGSGTVEDIVVTGSRVIQNGNSSPTPLTVVSASQLETARPGPVADALLELPVFAGSGSGSITGNGATEGNSGQHTLNLRNLGTTRTLILFDGRRVLPTSPLAEVNIDVVPTLLLSRVDVVTGGASAVYGSDAVAGVVNFVTDRKFNGLKADVQRGISQYGDSSEIKVAAAVGTEFASGRGHIEAGLEYYDNPGVESNLERPWFANAITIQGRGTTSVPYRVYYNSRANLYSSNGLIRSGPLSGMSFQQNGVLSPFVRGLPTANPSIESGGEGYWWAVAGAQAALRRKQAFGRVDYDLTDNIHAYGQITGNWIRNSNNSANPGFFTPFTISADNPFLSTAVRSQLPPGGTFTMTRVFTDAPLSIAISKTTGYIAHAGLEGKIDGWKWDLSYGRSESSQLTYTNHNWNNQRGAAALDAVINPSTGQIVCRVTLTNPGLYPGCVPLNPFGPTASDPAALAYAIIRSQFRSVTKLDDIGGSISGSPFDTWAGPVQLALSGEWRKTTFVLKSSADPTQRTDCTGLRFNCTPTTQPFTQAVIASSSGAQTVAEGAIEVEAPLLKDVRFAEDLRVNGAARYTHYDTSGNVTTWKIGLTWKVNDQITLRGTRSRDIRAPNLNELAAPLQSRLTPVADIHTGLSQPTLVMTGSNPALTPEKADTWTAGLVLRPSFIPRLSFAVDWFSIRIGNAITSLSGADPTIQNLCESANGSGPFCALINRPLAFSDRSAANYPTSFLVRPVNAQSVKTSGVDFELNYSAPIGPGIFSLRALATYQPHFYTAQVPGAPVLDAADVPPLAKLRATAFLRYDWENLSFNLQERWRHSYQWNADRSLVYDPPRIPGRFYTNVTVTAKVQSQMEVFFSIENLFNQRPAIWGPPSWISPGRNFTTAPGDDNIGRYFTTGVRIRR